MRNVIAPALALLMAGLAIPCAASAAPVLRPQKPIEVSAAPQRFDLMAVDATRRRLLAAHSGAGTLTIVDLTTRKLLREVPVGRAAGVAVDARDGKYFVATNEGVAVVGRNALRKKALIATPGPADAMIFDRHNDRLYVGHDDAAELWIIDARHDKLAGRIALPGAPELMAIDPQTYRLYLNIKPDDEVVAIDPSTAKITAHWSTKPTISPHGLALDLRDRRLFVAGHGGTVSVFALPSGKPLGGIDIGLGRVDQIAFDATAHRLYCPGSGHLVAVKVARDGDSLAGSVPIPQSAHSVAIDPRSHEVWIAYAANGHSYVQGFAPAAAKKLPFARP